MQAINIFIQILIIKITLINGFSNSDDNFQLIRINANYSEVNEVIINNTVEYVMVFPKSSSTHPFRVKVWSYHVDDNYPVLVVVRQKKDVLSWQIPLLVETTNGMLQFYNTSRTLCHNDMTLINSIPTRGVDSSLVSQTIIVAVSTSSERTLKVCVQVEKEQTFFIEQNLKYSVRISPSEPRYVYYKFGIEENDSARVVVEIDSDDDVCLTVSIQDSTCPVFDLNKDITYEGKYETVNRKGGITVRKKEFPSGFFLIFVAKGDNFECSQEFSIIPVPRSTVIFAMNRTSDVYFTIKQTISAEEYLIASVVTLVVILAFCVMSLIIVCSFHKWGRISKVLARVSQPDGGTIGGEQMQVINRPPDEVDTLIHTDVLYLTFLSKNPVINKRRSYNYLWHILSIALFYSIPVVQLVVIYQRVVNQTGNQDLCYYNFLCSHPAFGFSDFNHIFSNVGYVIIGILFLVVVLYRHTTTRAKKGFGVPMHYGLFYSMGVALIIEGLLSACYHICPSQANYQFDTSFMYIMAVLCMVKLYQNRHPDINATAYATFTVLGIAIFSAMVGILNGSLFVWTLFIVCYIFFIIYLSIKIYFVSYVIEGFKQFKNELMGHGINLSTLVPIKKGRFITLLVVNILNYVMLILGLYLYYRGDIDFGTFLLAILMGNGIVHATFYVLMKLLHNERICSEALLFCGLAMVTWAFSAYFFMDYSTQWTVTPAESRQKNQNCTVMDFYDSHDVWHLLSAPALFFTFVFLLCLDDDLVITSQDEIPVF